MKGFTLLFSLFTIFSISAQENLPKNSPFEYGASYIGDFVNNYSGGIKNGSLYLGMANFNISFDTDLAGLWQNGMLYINAANTHGGTPTGDLIGDFQGVSNIEAGNLTYFHELWYKHSFESFSITAGLQDLAADFAVSEYGALFLNSSFGTHPTIGSNMPTPIFPLTALGLQAWIKLDKSFQLKTAFYDGLPDDHETNPYNLSWKLNKDEGFLSISEIQYTSELFEGLNGSYKFGAYYHTHMILDTKDKAESISDNYGFYVVADQVISKFSESKMLALFIQAGLGPYGKNDNHFYFGTGLNYFGLFDDDDILGIGAASAQLHSTGLRNETAFELSYLFNITNFFSVQPDFQYIINPSGTEEILENTFTANLRTTISF